MLSYRVGWRHFGVQEVEIEDGTHECTWLLAGEILRCCCAIELSVLRLEQCTSMWRNVPECCTAPATAPVTRDQSFQLQDGFTAIVLIHLSILPSALCSGARAKVPPRSLR